MAGAARGCSCRHATPREPATRSGSDTAAQRDRPSSQLPFLALTNSYLALLTHAFWPTGEGADAETDAPSRRGVEMGIKDQGLLDDDDD